MVTGNALTKALFDSADQAYGDFSAKLAPGITRDRVIGVRSPELKKIAKEYARTPEAREFLDSLPHVYFDENNLHSALINRIRDPYEALNEIERFLPYVDNWATCDTMSPKSLKKALPELEKRIRLWIVSDKTFTVRFAVVSLMSFFLDDAFDPAYPELVSSVRSDEYYVKMALAWYFATGLAKQYDVCVRYIEQRRLDPWTHNKSIQKARESFRVSDEHKEYLKTLKI